MADEYSTDNNATIAPTLDFSGWDEDHTFAYNPVERATTIVSILTNFLSLFSAVCILCETSYDQFVQTNDAGAVTRILMCWSIGAIFMVSGYAMGTLAIPKEYAPAIWGAAGTKLTCIVQGALMAVGIVTLSVWDIALSFTYVFIVRYHWTKARLQAWERSLHVILWPSILAFFVLGIVTESFNVDSDTCYLAQGPYGCEFDDDKIGGMECTTGKAATPMVLLSMLLMILGAVVDITCMTILYRTVRTLEIRNERYLSSFRQDDNIRHDADRRTNRITATAKMLLSTAYTVMRGNGNDTVPYAPQETEMRTVQEQEQHRELQQRNKLSRQVGLQGILYSSIWLFSLGPNVVMALVRVSLGIRLRPLFLISQILGGLYGFFYLLVFIRRKKMKTVYGRLVKKILLACRRKLCCCDCCCCRETRSNTVERNIVSAPTPSPSSHNSKEENHVSNETCTEDSKSQEADALAPTASDICNAPATLLFHTMKMEEEDEESQVWLSTTSTQHC